MSEILLLNPRRKRRKTTTKRTTSKRRNPRIRRRRKSAQKRSISMAATIPRKRRRRTYRKRATTPRQNPTRRGGRGRAIARRAKGAIGGLNFKQALKDVPVQTLGMFAATWAAKLGSPDATQTDPESWDYSSYLKGAAGAAVAGIALNFAKPGAGQKVLVGGLSLMLFKLVQNELIPKSEWATNQFGQDEGQQYQPGDVEVNSAQEPFILGQDMQWHPMYDSARDQPMLGDEGILQPVGPLGALSDALETPGRLGFGQSTRAAFERSLFSR